MKFGHHHHDEDSDEEMVGLLGRSPNGTNSKSLGSPQGKTKKKPVSSAVLKPLEIMHSSQELRVKLDDVDSSKSAFHIGLLLLFLSFGGGAWYYNTHSDNFVATTSLIRWHRLKLKDIKQWCLDPSSTSCNCANPLEPKNREKHKTWQLAHDGNIRDAMSAFGVDVVFLGDSIIEGWRGMSFGLPNDAKRSNIAVFDSLFQKRKGADFQGLALGIAGDKTTNLLWRIQNNEIPDSLHPSVWWIEIGTNDFLRENHCSPEVVLMGIQRVVEELHKMRPGGIIVVNSLLPRTDTDDGTLVVPGKISVWQGIMEVNRGLRIYCDKYRNVIFFDATAIFVQQRPNTVGVDGQYIPKSLMADYLHPTSEGYKLWGEEIVATIHQLIDASQSEKGRLPLPPWWKGQSKPEEGLINNKLPPTQSQSP